MQKYCLHLYAVLCSLLLCSCHRQELVLLKNRNGPDLSQWEVTIGDGLYTAAGEAPVDTADLGTLHFGHYSELRANIRHRRIQAHNITFLRETDDRALYSEHSAAFRLQLPYLPDATDTALNGQTIEAGLFVWDGSDTRLDYGSAFQWVINPHLTEYGVLQVWNGAAWDYLDRITPDTAPHRIEFYLSVPEKKARLRWDGRSYSQNLFSQTTKSGWGIETAARFQIEIISLYPPASGPVPEHRLLVSDWLWNWLG